MRLSISVPTDGSPWISACAEPTGPRLSIGIIVLDKNKQERVVELIPAGVVLPIQRSFRFAYAFDNMTAVRVEITAGPGTTRDQVRVIGQVTLMGLPPRPRGTPIEVVLDHLGEALIVTVTDVETGETRTGAIPLANVERSTE